MGGQSHFKKMGERQENILQGCGFIIGLINYKTGLLPQIMFLLPSRATKSDQFSDSGGKQGIYLPSVSSLPL